MTNVNVCVFCSVVKKIIPATVIAENEHVLVIKDIAPKAPIHYLIIPKIHVQDVAHLTEDQTIIGTHMFAMAQQVALTLSGNASFRLIINNGKAVGQTVFHLHMHLLAGMLNMGLTDI